MQRNIRLHLDTKEGPTRTKERANSTSELTGRTEFAQSLAFRELWVFLDSLAGVRVDSDVVALKRRVRRERVHHRRRRHRHADRRALEEANCNGRVVRNHVRHDGQKDKADGTAADSATRHDALPNLGHRAPDVTTLQECADDTDRTDKGTVLLVVPVEHCRVCQ